MTENSSEMSQGVTFEEVTFVGWANATLRLARYLGDSDEATEMLGLFIMACRPGAPEWPVLSPNAAELRDVTREMLVQLWELRTRSEWPFLADRAVVVPDTFEAEDWS